MTTPQSWLNEGLVERIDNCLLTEADRMQLESLCDWLYEGADTRMSANDPVGTRLFEVCDTIARVLEKAEASHADCATLAGALEIAGALIADPGV